VDPLEKVKRAGSKVSPADLFWLLLKAWELRYKLYSFRACLDGSKLILQGELEGEVKINSRDVLEFLSKIVPVCEK